MNPPTTLAHKHNPLLHPSPSPSTQTTLHSSFLPFPSPTTRQREKLRRIPRHNPSFRVRSSANPNWPSDGFSWQGLARSLRLGSERFFAKFGQSVKRETGFDAEEVNVKVGEFVERVKREVDMGGGELTRFRTEILPQFVEWNRWEFWKDFKNWEAKRFGALILYVFVVIFSCQRMYVSIRAPYVERQRGQLAEAYMEALIPEPSPINIRKFKKGMWRKTAPKGLKMKKFVEGPNGMIVHDESYVGENAWNDDLESPHEKMKQIIENDGTLNVSKKRELKEDLGISAELQESNGTWRDRLHVWKEVLRKEKLAEQLDTSKAKYVVEFDMKEVENSLRKDVLEKVTDSEGGRASWISKRWWCYRPKLPYTYLLQKLDFSEVAAVVFTEDLKRLYVIMKEGFPLEYIVDIPLDPYLFEIISSSGVEVDLLQKRQIHYLLKVVIALVPGFLILWLIKDSVTLLSITANRFIYRKYKQLLDKAYASNLIAPVKDVGETKSKFKNVVLGGDVWDLLDEIMIYMQNPMQYYEKEVKFVRGVLLSGPPGTGKTLFARTLAKESGVPFVFASGAEFTGIGRGEVARINRLFALARRNAPCFVFIDEIDAIAGRSARRDKRRKRILNALIAQLDGDKGVSGVDRFSLAQAVIFICATNRPNQLDKEFLRAGRIDRHLFIGLPDAKQRIQIFDVHSSGRQYAEDVDFRKLVFRTVGFSGADIRNLINEAAIMSVRKGHPKIYQQDFVDVLDKQLLEGMGVLLTEDEQLKCEQLVTLKKKRLLAVHEAGHIVLAHLFPRFDWHAFSQLLPGGKETAISVFYPREDMIGKSYTTFGYMKMKMVVAHGGRCAERLVFGLENSEGGRKDLKRLTKLAREMVISPQNARLGLFQLTRRVGMKNRRERPDRKLIEYKWLKRLPTPMTVEVSEIFTRELERYIEETEEIAMKGLRENLHIVDAIAKELLEKSRLTGSEVEAIMKEFSPTMFEDFVKPFQINLDEEGPLPHNDKLRYQPLDVYPAPLHRC